MFWDSSMLEPKRQHRWFLELKGVPAYTVSKVSKPSFTISDVGHKYLNHTYYFPGKVEWEKVSVTLVDPVQPDAAWTVMSLITASGYVPPANGNSKMFTISKRKAVQSLGKVNIVQINSDGDPVETWELHNAWISSVKFGELSFEEDGLTNVELEFRYDYAVFHAGQDSGKPELNELPTEMLPYVGSRTLPNNKPGPSVSIIQGLAGR